MGLFEGRLFSELAPAVQLAHDLGDVHRGGRLPRLGFLFQLPEDDGAGAGAQVPPHEREARAGREEGVVGGGSTGHLAGRGPSSSWETSRGTLGGPPTAGGWGLSEAQCHQLLEAARGLGQRRAQTTRHSVWKPTSVLSFLEERKGQGGQGELEHLFSKVKVLVRK